MTKLALDTEEVRIGVVMTLTMCIWAMTVIFAVLDFAQYAIPYVMSIGSLLLLAIVAYNLYYVFRGKKKEKPEPLDERTTMCSLKAARNGFLAALVLIAGGALIGDLGVPLRDIMAFQIVWALVGSTYTLSYLYYKRVD